MSDIPDPSSPGKDLSNITTESTPKRFKSSPKSQKCSTATASRSSSSSSPGKKAPWPAAAKAKSYSFFDLTLDSDEEIVFQYSKRNRKRKRKSPSKQLGNGRPIIAASNPVEDSRTAAAAAAAADGTQDNGGEDTGSSDIKKDTVPTKRKEAPDESLTEASKTAHPEDDDDNDGVTDLTMTTPTKPSKSSHLDRKLRLSSPAAPATTMMIGASVQRRRRNWVGKSPPAKAPAVKEYPPMTAARAAPKNDANESDYSSDGDKKMPARKLPAQKESTNYESDVGFSSSSSSSSSSDDDDLYRHVRKKHKMVSLKKKAALKKASSKSGKPPPPPPPPKRKKIVPKPKVKKSKRDGTSDWEDDTDSEDEISGDVKHTATGTPAAVAGATAVITPENDPPASGSADSPVSIASSTTASNSDDIDGDTVMVVKPEQARGAAVGRRRLESSLTAGAHASQHSAGHDGDIEFVRTENEQRLSHMRQHCLDYKFDPTHRLSINMLFCDKCYCYVCDVPAKDCVSWANPSGHMLSNHCNAHDSNSRAKYWKTKREAAKAAAALNNNANNNNNNNNGALVAHNSSSNNNNLYQGPLAYGPGPFAPDDQSALQDPNLTECRKCGWHNRFFHRNFCHFKSSHPVGFLDWCHKCGRVASEKDFGKVQAEPFESQQGDVFLGTKQVTFRIKAHDPREMERYDDSWLSAGEDQPEWQFSEEDMREDLFRHRFGEHPTLRMILASISILKESDLPVDGGFELEQDRGAHMYAIDLRGDYNDRVGDIFSYWKTPKPSYLQMDAENASASADECSGIFLDNAHHLVLLQQLAYFEAEGWCKRRHATKNTEGKKSVLSYHINAEWDKQSQKGTFAIQVYVRPPKTRFKAKGLASFNKLLGSWFDIFPFALSDLSGGLLAEDPEATDNEYGSEYASDAHPAPPFTLSDDARCEIMEECKQDIYKQISDHNTRAVSVRNAMCLESTQETVGLGGICHVDGGFSNVLKHYFGEMLVEDAAQGVRDNRFVLAAKGIISSHRNMRKTGQSLLSDEVGVTHCKYNGVDRSRKHDLCYLQEKDKPLAYSLQNACESILEGTQSMAGITAHLENLSHEEVPYVDGLNVELLQFQRQAVQWCLERETVAGGIQSLLWPEVPQVASPRKKTLYYNPIIETFRRDKPHVIRGGILASEMGLGKTVICLALILSNPAPHYPISGSPISKLDEYEVEDNAAAWDTDLYERTSANAPKRGKIISRGTLVVCHVSLVGQWIEEAKSKLEDPGLVYPYHGTRTRDAKKIAKNAIVVTTYETLASDDNYHRKAHDNSPNYVPPLEQVRWWRVICDESHSLRDATTTKSKACMGLVADIKWLVSGTPMMTSLTDLRNQMNFLGIERVDELWQTFANVLQHTNDRTAKMGKKRRGRDREQLENASPGLPQVAHFVFLMRLLMSRHSQRQTYRGTTTTLMSLPPKTERVVEVEFTKEDRTEYATLEANALAFYTSFKAKNPGKVGRAFLKLSAKLKPLRIACSGGRIPLDDPSDKGDGDSDDEGEEGEGKKKAKAIKYSKYIFRSKMKKLIALLKDVGEDPTAKSLVFSQFPSSVQYLQEELPRHGFQFRTLRGDMSMRARAQALHDFQHDPPTTVFLLSMRSGACGINLTQANRVFILDPVFNPGLLAQAIGRVHRLGQKRPVEVTLLRMKDSIDTRIAEMVDKKYGKGEDSHGDHKNNDNHTLLGHVNKDKAEIVTEEFDLLFGFQPPLPPPLAAVAPNNGVNGYDDAMLLPDGVFSRYGGGEPRDGSQSGLI